MKYLDSLIEMAEDYNTDVSLDILNDHCLEHVFSYLPTIAEKMRLERVSKRWQAIFQNFWRSVRVLDLKENTNMKWGVSGKKLAERLRADFIIKILRLCGDNLRKISTDNRRISSIIIENAGQSCSNLEYVEIAGCTATLMTSEKSLAVCDKLVIKRFIDDECFPRLFSRLRILRCLEIHANPGEGWMASGFLNLPKTIEELSIIYVRIDVGCLNRAIQTFSNLRFIELDSTNYMSAEFFETICFLRTLTQLKLHGPMIGRSVFNHRLRLNRMRGLTEAIQLVLNMGNLEVFAFTTESKDGNYTGFEHSRADHYITNDVIRRISEDCPNLRSLDISGSGEVTDVGLNTLSSCANLERLIINQVRNVTDSSLAGLTNLKVLQCVGCRGVEDAGIISLMKNAPRLEVLDLSRTSITIATIATARNIVARENGQPLELVVDSIIWESYRSIYGWSRLPFVTIINSTLLRRV